MKSQYQLYGVQVSLFVGKVRGYLNYKGLDYKEKAPTLCDLFYRFPKKVGAAVVPVIKSRDGEWLADSTDIIETLESRHPQPSIRPSSPCQTIAAMLSEGDSLVVHSGKRYLVMKPRDLEHYRGERGRRGHKLPRGFQKVDRLGRRYPIN